MRRSTIISLLPAALLLVSAQLSYAQQRIEVEAGQDSLLAAVAQATPGDTLVLTTDGGMYADSTKLEIRMPLTIMAAPGLMKRPVLVNNGNEGTRDIIRMYDDLTLIGLEFDGLAHQGEQTKYAIRNSTGSDQADVKENYNLKIFDCYFHDIVHGSDGNAFRAYGSTYADSIIIRNSLFHNTGKEAVRVRDEDSDRRGFGFFNVNYFEVSHSTFWDINRDGISVYGGDEDPITPGPKVVIDHVTMHNVGQYGINLKDVEDAVVSNTIIMDNNTMVNGLSGSFGAPWLVPGALITHSDTLNVSDDADWTGGRGDPTIENLLAVDPMFTDPDNGDFTLMAGSPVIGAGINGASLGDRRWWPEGVTAPMVHQVTAGQNTIMDAVAMAGPGDIIELMDSGGEYLNDDQINVRMPLTVRAAAGLAERPVLKNNEPDESTRVVFRIYDSLHLDGIEIDGMAGTDFNAKYLLRIDGEVDSSMVLKVTNSYLHDVVAGSDGNFLRQYTGTYADSLIFRNTIFSGAGKEGLRSKDEASNSGLYNFGYFEVSNSTLANTRQAAIYIYAGDGDDTTPEPTVVMDHITCYNCGHGNGRAFYPRGFQNVSITNSIIANSKMDAEFSVKLEGASMISYSDTFMVAPVVLNGTSTATDMYNIDPEFNDPDMLDFGIPMANALRMAGSGSMGIGDMRWLADPTSAEELVVPEEHGIVLGQNYPNPFQVQTTIPFRLERQGYVTLEVYDLLGRRISRVKEGFESAGAHTVTLSMDQQAPGTYFYRLRVDDSTSWQKMVVVR
ncbi:MAG: DUF5123 domain-containing protein [Bacteroidota bacterium]|nr:DUF5123 domain-containing protein [Bacteroidota bacterium]